MVVKLNKKQHQINVSIYRQCETTAGPTREKYVYDKKQNNLTQYKTLSTKTCNDVSMKLQLLQGNDSSPDFVLKVIIKHPHLPTRFTNIV